MNTINIEKETDIYKLREHCHMLQSLILINNVSPLEELVDKCITDNRNYLKKISQELQYMDYSNDSSEQLLKLINYYKHLQNELQKFL